MKTSACATLLSLALLGGGSVLGQTTATTDPVGFSNLAIPVGTSLVVPTLNNTSVFVGMAAISSDGLTITPTTAPGWTANAYAKTAFANPTPNYPTYYAEVIAGPQEGLVIDIDSNSATALTAMANEISVASGIRGTTVQIALRQHVTLDKAVQGATGLTAFADAFSVFNSNGSQSVRYYDGASFVDESFANQAGHTVIYPGTGFVITASNPVTLTFMGGVKTTKTQINMYAGATNIVGPLNPASSTLLYGNTSLAQALSPYADGMSNFSATGTMATLGAYFSDGTNILDAGFTALSPSATDNIAVNRGIVVTVGADTTWTVPSPIPAAP